MNALLLAAAMTCSPLLSHKVPDILGQAQDLCEYAGKVVLVVNTASYCGYTPQYKGLQALHEKYRNRGLVILGFPSNDFGKQEHGSPKWNFHKYLIARDGKTVASFPSKVDPESPEFTAKVEQLLAR